MKTSSPMVIISGPSGVGKSTILAALCKDSDLGLCDVVTCTTRSIREGEIQGEPYYFFTKKEFEQKIQEGYFVEWATVHQKFYYGIPKEGLKRIWDQDLCPIMDINVDGMMSIKGLYPSCLSIFLLPPSTGVLKERLLSRGKMSEAELGLRLGSLSRELEYQKHFDHCVVNQNLEETFKQLKKLIKTYILDKDS